MMYGRCPDCDDIKDQFFPSMGSHGNGRCHVCHGTGHVSEAFIGAVDCRGCFATGQCQRCGGKGEAYVEQSSSSNSTFFWDAEPTPPAQPDNSAPASQYLQPAAPPSRYSGSGPILYDASPPKALPTPIEYSDRI